MADYRFPVRGYPKGKIALHWDVSPNAADLFAVRGTVIQAMVNGVITYVGNDNLGGHNLLMKGDPDTKSLQYYMAHMNKAPLVRVGQKVTAGQPLGEVGNTGNASNVAPHLHIGIGLSIKDGGGAEGGAGVPWDGNNCNAYLQHILNEVGSDGPIPVPTPTNYETVLRVLTAADGGVLIALRDRERNLRLIATQATAEANEVRNVISEIERNRPA